MDCLNGPEFSAGKIRWIPGTPYLSLKAYTTELIKASLEVTGIYRPSVCVQKSVISEDHYGKPGRQICISGPPSLESRGGGSANNQKSPKGVRY